MRSFALKSVSVLITITLACFNVYAECKCTCQPAPPGGTTYCDSGIAVCGTGSGGICEGRCVGPSGTSSLEIAASSLSAVLGGDFTAEDLRRNRDQARDAISTLLGSESTTEVTVTFEGRSLKGTFGISADIATSLRDALTSLTGSGDVDAVPPREVLETIPGLPADVTPAELEQHRRKLEKYREELEKERRSREIDIDTYKEGMDKYKDGIKQYKDAVRPTNQEPPDTLNE